MVGEVSRSCGSFVCVLCGGEEGVGSRSVDVGVVGR